MFASKLPDTTRRSWYWIEVSETEPDVWNAVMFRKNLDGSYRHFYDAARPTREGAIKACQNGAYLNHDASVSIHDV